MNIQTLNLTIEIEVRAPEGAEMTPAVSAALDQLLSDMRWGAGEGHWIALKRGEAKATLRVAHQSLVIDHPIADAEPQLERAVMGGEPWFDAPQGMEHGP